MKELSIKFFSIFIILMFCVAPLSALDLNAGHDNNKYKINSSDVSDIHVDDMDIAKDNSQKKNADIDDGTDNQNKDIADSHKMLILKSSIIHL